MISKQYLFLYFGIVTCFVHGSEPGITVSSVPILKHTSDVIAVAPSTQQTNPYTTSIVDVHQHPGMPVSRHSSKSSDAHLKQPKIDLRKDQQYLSSTGKLIKFDDFMKLYAKLGIEGNIKELERREGSLRNRIRKFWSPAWLNSERYTLERRLSFLLKVKDTSLAQAMHKIQYGSASEAKQALCEMYVDIYGHAHSVYGAPVAYMPQLFLQNGVIPSKFNPEDFQKAEQIYLSRKADFAPVVDLTPTFPTKITNISSDVDAKILHELSHRVKADPLTDFDTYMKEVRDVLHDMEQKGELIPAPNRNQEILFLFFETVLERQHPVTQFKDSMYSIANFAKWSLTEGGKYFHISADQCRNADKIIDELFVTISSLDPRKLTEEQRARLFGTLVGDIIHFQGLGASFRYLSEIGVLTKTEQTVTNLVTKLDKIMETAPSEVIRVAIIDGEVMEISNKIPLFQHMSSEAGKGASSSLPSLVREVVKDVEQAEYTFTKAAAEHLNKIVKHGKHAGQLDRPYMRSPLTIREIVATGKGIPDLTAKNALKFNIPGRFRGSDGFWELVIDVEKKLIYHFNFVGRK